MVPPVVAEHLCCDDPLCTIRDATDLTDRDRKDHCVGFVTSLSAF